ncbi:MAG: LLM class flavin-dependent oxidoreductase, partial [Candidatus Thorarchaeota archaeon]
DFNAVTDYIPMRYNREETMQAIEQVPKEVLDWFYIAGNAETIIKKLEEYARAGMNHIILWNITGMFDLERVRSSYKVLKEILAYVKG